MLQRTRRVVLVRLGEGLVVALWTSGEWCDAVELAGNDGASAFWFGEVAQQRDQFVFVTASVDVDVDLTGTAENPGGPRSSLPVDAHCRLAGAILGWLL